MDSKEFGLVAAQQLFQVKDLHYGFWENGITPSLNNFVEAQEKYTAFLHKHIKQALQGRQDHRILDIGCGVGTIVRYFLEAGYAIDGLVPSGWMAEQAQKNIHEFRERVDSKIYQCGIENFPIEKLSQKYDLVFFSESFQYVNMKDAFAVLKQILSKDGTVIIFDFFSRDGVPGKSPLGGGHSIGRFYETLEQSGYFIQTDLDVNANISPNMILLNDILIERLIPFGNSLDRFLEARHKFFYGLLKYFFRKQLNKIKRKYSSERNQANFIKYKTYRLLILKQA